MDAIIIEVKLADKNIVDIADREKIAIPAPCYRNHRVKGCCNACVIEVNGENQYACTTKPLEGMNIVVNRDDLKQLRNERMKIYAYNEKNNIKGECDCGDDCGCGDDSDCCG